MKKTQMLLIALLIGAMNFNSMAIAAAPAKPAAAKAHETKSNELTRERAADILNNKSEEANTKYIKANVELIVKFAGKGDAQKIETALLYDDPKNPVLFLAIHKIISEKNEAAAKVVADLAKGVKSETEAAQLATIASKKLSDIPGANEFIQNVKSDLKVSSLTDALIKQAGVQAGKLKEKMTAEEWLKKFMECV